MNFKNSCQPSALSLQLNPKPYRLLNWKRLRAPFCPYFFRSLARGSRVTMPSAFSLASFQPSGNGKQNERGRQLAEVQRGERRADPFALAVDA